MSTQASGERMDSAAIIKYLHTHIPISAAMGVELVSESAEQITLSAPFAPNINHQNTVFGGSIASVATLAAWTMIYVRLRRENLQGDLVVQRSSLDYLLPMRDVFTATCEMDEAAWLKFTTIFAKRRKGRLHMSSNVYCDGKLGCRLTGDFVVIGH